MHPALDQVLWYEPEDQDAGDFVTMEKSEMLLAGLGKWFLLKHWWCVMLSLAELRRFHFPTCANASGHSLFAVSSLSGKYSKHGYFTLFCHFSSTLRFQEVCCGLAARFVYVLDISSSFECVDPHIFFRPVKMFLRSTSSRGGILHLRSVVSLRGHEGAWTR